MKNKILAAGILTALFVFAGSAFAQQGNGGADVQVQNQNQNQEQNRGDSIQVQSQNQEMERETQADVEQRKSEVANAVQKMLQVADRTGGIGEQVREIAQNQNQNQEKLEASLEKIKSRGNAAKFFIGADYREIKSAEKILEQNREQAEQLVQIKNQLSNQSDLQNLEQQIQVIEQANLEIENSLNLNKKGFSLLGWMFKLFSGN